MSHLSVAGKPLSVLDGVPIAVKDEIDCLPYATTGTRITNNKVKLIAVVSLGWSPNCCKG